jgi:putative transposase
MIDVQHPELSICKQCSLLAVNRSNVYYEPMPARNDTELANEIHELWLEMPFMATEELPLISIGVGM